MMIAVAKFIIRTKYISVYKNFCPNRPSYFEEHGDLAGDSESIHVLFEF